MRKYQTTKRRRRFFEDSGKTFLKSTMKRTAILICNTMLWCKITSQIIDTDFSHTEKHKQPNLTMITISQDPSQQEISSVVKKDKAPGQSGVRKTVMQHLPDVAIAELKTIFNWALSVGYFPTKFKNAIMVLIPKAGKDPPKVENYRPISLLEIPGKIFEKIINDRVKMHMENNGLFNPNQYGFRKGRGTQQAITSIYETIAISQRKRQQCNIVCCDIAKAFDKLWKPGLHFKILQINLPAIVEKALCNFLEDRTATLKIGNKVEPKFPLLSGVPQGSILSPTLFIFYTADLERPRNNCADVSFADDNTQIIIYPLTKKEALATTTVNEIRRINDFEHKWKIKTNKTKFQLLSISATKPREVVVDNERIPFKSKVTVLGMEFGTRGVSTHTKRRLATAIYQTQTLCENEFKNTAPFL